MQSFIFWDKEAKLHLGVWQDSDGNLCPYVILDSRLSKQLAAYTSMFKDLNECLHSISYLKSILYSKKVEQVVTQSLLFASIVKYAKCFTSGEGRGTSLNSKNVFKKELLKHKEFHNEVMHIRNQYLAHAGNTAHETRAMVAILNPDLEDKRIDRLIYAGFSLKDDDSNIDNYIELINSVLLHVKNRMTKIEELLVEQLKNTDIDSLYKESKKPIEEELIPFNVHQLKR